ncbi:uncharacterized protein LOC117072529 [Trachypithecus francoisi]|uniref:uncharacterized protein LOC117072529 n=1 Tax=Trachypithecus francoisi TaxID=54180 RepID=UPI00141B0D32|nr:uncharacterized protein LOC117072529 [Trachypithecus francoisi]
MKHLLFLRSPLEDETHPTIQPREKWGNFGKRTDVNAEVQMAMQEPPLIARNCQKKLSSPLIVGICTKLATALQRRDFQKECCQSPEADMFIKLCILKSDIKSVAFGTAEKHSVNTMESASPWCWPQPKECRGTDKNLTQGQKLQDEGKSDLRRTSLFHRVCLISRVSIQTTNRSVLR